MTRARRKRRGEPTEQTHERDAIEAAHNGERSCCVRTERQADRRARPERTRSAEGDDAGTSTRA